MLLAVDLRLLLAPAAALLLGCPNTDTAIFVAPSIDDPACTVSSSVLGTGITSGAFQLSLHLGARASGTSMVSLGSFSILDATEKTTIVDALKVSSTTHFPVAVAQDSTVVADFTLGDMGMPQILSESEGMDLCAPPGVVIGGSIQDSLEDGQTTAYSDVFHPSGCM
jgi:hypothetical protein